MEYKLSGKTRIVQGMIFTLVLLGASCSFALAATDDEGGPIVGTPAISESKALSIAENAYTGDGAFTDIELEMEDGILVYAVEYTEGDGNEVDVKINAKTGTVVLVESDRDEAIDDDVNDTDDDEDQVAKMQTLINLLNQLIVLLRQQSNG